MAINLIVPATLLISLFFISHYRYHLLQSEISTLSIQTAGLAATLEGNESADRAIDSKRLLQHIAQITNTDISLFDKNGTPLYHISSADNEDHPLINVFLGHDNDTAKETSWQTSGFKKLSDKFLFTPPAHSVFNNPVDALRFLKTPPQSWHTPDDRIILTASTALYDPQGEVYGFLLGLRDMAGLNQTMEALKFDVLTIFLALLGMTLLLSAYLSETISHPLNRLAKAAEKIKNNTKDSAIMPDFSARQDEIGTLSVALQDMTNALHERIDAIESFAADVAHELKNPLTSLRSAVETLDKVTKKEDRAKLTTVIQHDIGRMNRLITDISSASRLDAALEREAMASLNLKEFLHNIVTAQNIGQRPAMTLTFHTAENLNILGNAARLEQVFTNLLSNARSFSPPDGPITLDVARTNDHITITVTDQGPGIPQGKEKAIFERFYTERPDHEAYGQHSGLGLAISHYIIAAHHGTIHVENHYNDDGAIKGARFIVTLPLEHHDSRS